MAGPANSIGGYRNKLKTTYHSVLLVEGPGDKQVFEHLKLRAIENGFNLSTKLRIDAAQTLISSSGSYPGIRQRIEQVCRDLPPDNLHAPFAAFVDREFDDFSDDIKDLAQQPKVVGRYLVYSRGHSIENYFFTVETFSGAFRSLVGVSSLLDVLQKFDAVFQSALAIGCALGLAARDHNCLGIIRDSVRLETIEVSDLVVVDTSKLRAVLASRLELKVDALIQNFQQWLQKVVAADRHVVRWMCDGHIGYIILWHTLIQCVQLISDGNMSEVALVRGTQKDARLNACAEVWARSLSRTSEHPQRLLDMLADDELTIVPSTEA